MVEITDELLDKHIDNILDVIKSIQEGKITVIVGNNGVGKSLIRKQLHFKFQKKYGDRPSYIRAVSMQQRTENRSEMWGALGLALHDDETSPTSLWTYYLIEQTFKLDENKKYYYIFDELELGMSTETILSVLNKIKEQVPEFLEKSLGILVITHSTFVADYFMDYFDCDFYNIGFGTVDKDYNAWKYRKIVGIDLDWLQDWSHKLYLRINERSEKK